MIPFITPSTISFLQLDLLLALDVPLDQVTVVVSSKKVFIKTTPEHGGYLGEEWVKGSNFPILIGWGLNLLYMGIHF